MQTLWFDGKQKWLTSLNSSKQILQNRWFWNLSFTSTGTLSPLPKLCTENDDDENDSKKNSPNRRSFSGVSNIWRLLCWQSPVRDYPTFVEYLASSTKISMLHKRQLQPKRTEYTNREEWSLNILSGMCSNQCTPKYVCTTNVQNCVHSLFVLCCMCDWGIVAYLISDENNLIRFLLRH